MRPSKKKSIAKKVAIGAGIGAVGYAGYRIRKHLRRPKLATKTDYLQDMIDRGRGAAKRLSDKERRLRREYGRARGWDLTKDTTPQKPMTYGRWLGQRARKKILGLD